MTRNQYLETVAAATTISSALGGFPSGAWMALAHGEFVRGFALLVMGTAVAYVAIAILVANVSIEIELHKKMQLKKEAERKARFRRRMAAQRRDEEFSSLARTYAKN
jgi:hypothetical protein